MSQLAVYLALGVRVYLEMESIGCRVQSTASAFGESVPMRYTWSMFSRWPATHATQSPSLVKARLLSSACAVHALCGCISAARVELGDGVRPAFGVAGGDMLYGTLLRRDSGSVGMGDVRS